jgi:hypothetical protein
MPGNEWHHRRSRSVKDEHTNCPCNGIVLCGWGNHTGCHGWAHSNPAAARAGGLIVSRHVAVPGEVRIVTQQHGTVWLQCNGTVLSC